MSAALEYEWELEEEARVALVSRGGCTFDSKVQRVRAAGGAGWNRTSRFAVMNSWI